jgi:predicted DCC family thiol-disulfide oxidoreductase YuxK
MGIAPRATTQRSAVLFDGSCPLCTREIAMYRKLPASACMEWVDVSAPGYRPPAGATRDALMRRFHTITPTGQVLSGAQAFAHVWSYLPGWQWLARLAKLPGVLPVMELAYRAFLVFRPSIQAAYRRFM